MESNDELKEIDIKNCTCYYFDDVMKIVDFNLNNFLIYEKYTKIFWFIRFNTKLWLMLNLWVLTYLEVQNLISFTTGLDIS